MQLSPEERRKIYEEEKAQIEEEKRRMMSAGESTTSLEPNVAGLLCYLGTWISGIIFLVIEQKNRFVRFHAFQSIIVFITLAIASAFLTWLPFIGGFFGAVIGILAFILWVVLMYKAYRGELYKVPIAGDLTERIFPVTHVEEKTIGVKEQKEVQPQAPLISSTSTLESETKESRRRMDNFFRNTRSARIASSSIAIAWSIALLVFFSFFYEYIAYYHPETVSGAVSWSRLPLLTSDYYAWLPILLSILVVSIACHIILIIYDNYFLREIIVIILNILGITVVSTLLTIFPFDFGAIPNSAVASALPIILTIVLIAVAVGIGIATFVMFIKFIINLAKSTVS